MSVYDTSGLQVYNLYDIEGYEIADAYDIEGNTIFPDEPGPQPVVDYSNYSYVQKWASKGVSATQGFDIYDDKVFWVSKSGNASIPANCYVWNLSDGSQAYDSAYTTIQSGHGNNLCFAYPKLYATSAYPPSSCYINNVSSDLKTFTLDKTLSFNDGSNDCDACVDENDTSILWTLGHTATSSDTSAPYYISKWDLSNLTDNGDGTYTPELIYTVPTQQPANSYYFQGCKFHDGILWYANGYSGSSTGAYVFGLNPTTGEVLYTINCETTAEPEGIVWYPDDDAVGGYALYVGFAGMMLRKYTFGERTVRPISYAGKSLSILGDSISTFAGYIPSGNSNFYTGENCGVSSVNETWWMRLMNGLGMTLNLNNSWSGSRVTTTNGTNSAGVTRASNLGTSPDVIIIFIGINDFNNEVELGTYTGSGTLPSTTTTFREAYAVMLSTVINTYPNSEVWCATLPVCERNDPIEPPLEINDSEVSLNEYNWAICQIAETFGVKVLGNASCGISYFNMSTYMGDWTSQGKALHPNAAGHELIANYDIAQMTKQT